MGKTDKIEVIDSIKDLKFNKTINRGNSESGRSMVEMLGTLAIMGVLAIGGIAGYRWAMDKYKANDILNEVRKLAVMASQQRMTGRDTISFDEYGSTVSGYTLDKAEEYDGDPNFFTISVEEIEKNVCDKVIQENPAFVVEKLLGETVISDTTVCGESNDLTFAFANDLNPNAELTEACEDTCPNGMTTEPCDADTEVEVKTETNDCDNTCYECAAKYTNFTDTSGTIYDCSKTGDSIMATSTECDKCRYSGSPRDMLGPFCVLSSVLAEKDTNGNPCGSDENSIMTTTGCQVVLGGCFGGQFYTSLEECQRFSSDVTVVALNTLSISTPDVVIPTPPGGSGGVSYNESTGECIIAPIGTCPQN